MSWYVRRRKEPAPALFPGGEEPVRHGWTGPIRSKKQATKEVAAWVDAGWVAQLEESSDAIKAEVREWEKHRRVVG